MASDTKGATGRLMHLEHRMWEMEGEGKVERNKGRKTRRAQMWAASCHTSLAQGKSGGNEGVRWGEDGIIFVFSER